MKKNNIPKARKDGLVIQEIEGETLIYDLKTNRAVCLNQTSALVWQNCDGTNTVSEIGTFLANGSNVPVNEDLIWLALDQLKKVNLIENSKELEIGFEGTSRREVIRKIGLSSMIALPVVASLVTPTAAQTGASCGNVVCTNTGNECATQPVGCRNCVNLGGNNRRCRP